MACPVTTCPDTTCPDNATELTMQYRIDPKSGNKLSALGYGCMRMPNNQAAVDDLILHAVERGVNYFDTAYIYPGSEVALGKALAKNQLRDRVFLATKLPHGRCKTLANVERIFQEHLNRLQTDHIDYYLIHDMTDVSQWERLVGLGILDWVEEKKASGAIRQMGFSFHGLLDSFGPLLDAYPWDFCMIQYNYANVNYQAGRAGLKLAASKGLPVFIMEPLLGGRLAVNLPKAAARRFKDANAERTPAEWGLRWLWDQPEVTCVLSGMNSMEMLDDNIDSACNSEPGCLSPEEQAVIEDVTGIFASAYKVNCTSCRYCMPCPAGIDIPNAFTAYNNSYVHGWFTGIQGHVMSTGSLKGAPHLIKNCTNCGACSKRCPQHLDVPALLKQARGRIEPPGLELGLAVYRRILG